MLLLLDPLIVEATFDFVAKTLGFSENLVEAVQHLTQALGGERLSFVRHLRVEQ